MQNENSGKVTYNEIKCSEKKMADKQNRTTYSSHNKMNEISFAFILYLFDLKTSKL